MRTRWREARRRRGAWARTRRLSQRPAASLASVLASSGATTMMSAHLRSCRRPAAAQVRAERGPSAGGPPSQRAERRARRGRTSMCRTGSPRAFQDCGRATRARDDRQRKLSLLGVGTATATPAHLPLHLVRVDLGVRDVLRLEKVAGTLRPHHLDVRLPGGNRAPPASGFVSVPSSASLHDLSPLHIRQRPAAAGRAAGS